MGRDQIMENLKGWEKEFRIYSNCSEKHLEDFLSRRVTEQMEILGRVPWLLDGE